MLKEGGGGEKGEWKQTRLMMRGASPSLLRASSYCGTYLKRSRKPFIVVSIETGNKGWKNIKGNVEGGRERKSKRQPKEGKRGKKSVLLWGKQRPSIHTTVVVRITAEPCVQRMLRDMYAVRQTARMSMSSELAALLNSVKLILILSWWIWLSENETLFLVPVCLTPMIRHNTHINKLILNVSTMKTEATGSCETRHSIPKARKCNIHRHENLKCHKLLLVQNTLLILT